MRRNTVHLINSTLLFNSFLFSSVLVGGLGCGVAFNNPLTGAATNALLTTRNSGQGGGVSTPLTGTFTPTGLLPGLGGLPTGAVFVGGGSTTYNGVAPNGARFVKVLSTGLPDTSFAGGAAGGFNASVMSVLQELDTSGQLTGWLLVGANNMSTYAGAANTLQLVRMSNSLALTGTALGVLDSTYNGASPATNGFNDKVLTLVQEIATTGYPTGKVLVGGGFTSYKDNAHPGGFGSTKVARILANGVYDTTWNPGQAGATGGGNNNFLVVVQELSTTTGLPTGNIIIGGDFVAYNGDGTVAHGLCRLTSNGAPDTTWNYGAGSGFATIDATHTVKAILPEYATNGLPTGKYIVGGSFSGNYNGTAMPTGLFRINANGTPDTTVFNSGQVGVNAGGGVVSLALEFNTTTGLPTGNLIVGGYFTSYNGNAAQKNLIRVDATGSQLVFNSGGVGPNTVATQGVVGIVNGMLPSGLPSGGYFLVGDMNNYDGAAAPVGFFGILPNGNLDTTFNSGNAGMAAFSSNFRVLIEKQ